MAGKDNVTPRVLPRPVPVQPSAGLLLGSIRLGFLTVLCCLVSCHPVGARGCTRRGSTAGSAFPRFNSRILRKRPSWSLLRKTVGMLTDLWKWCQMWSRSEGPKYFRYSRTWRAATGTWHHSPHTNHKWLLDRQIKTLLSRRKLLLLLQELLSCTALWQLPFLRQYYITNATFGKHKKKKKTSKVLHFLLKKHHTVIFGHRMLSALYRIVACSFPVESSSRAV